MGILQTVGREHVPFDPSNSDHRAAFWQLRTTGKQDERLRFILEEGYGSVLTMMQDRLACHFAKPKAKVIAKVEASVVPMTRRKS